MDPLKKPFGICGQCGETAQVGGHAYIPGKDIEPKWRCIGCLVWEVKEFNAAQGKETKNVLIVRPEDLQP